MIQFSNGSTIRFFTSGMRSGGKSDVARGQEAHVIVLDEMDYMHADDLDALYAMLQKTAEDQPDKVLIGASTPTGRRERFWEWCRSERFKEFWFPSYCNPFFSKEQEDEFREQYSEIGYRHEIEADWGEDAEGVYPRKFVDKAFVDPGWDYRAEVTSARNFYTIGVDWDKYGAGTNIVVLEVCSDSYEEERFRNKVKICYREEIQKSEYTLTKAVQRIVELNSIFQPKHIYVDRGYGEVQVELLHKYGVENPASGLREKVKGVSFSETIDIRDPYTKQIVKKEINIWLIILDSI
jgi:replicative DNA helicase